MRGRQVKWWRDEAWLRCAMRRMQISHLRKVLDRTVRDAGPRYSPGLDPDAPNIEIAYLSTYIEALAVDHLDHRVRPMVDDLERAIGETQGTWASIFRNRTITPSVVAKDLAELGTIEGLAGVRSRVSDLRRRIAALERVLDRAAERFSSAERALAGSDDADKERRDRLQAQTRDLYHLRGALGSIREFVMGDLGTLMSRKKCLLVLGPAGSGKTHFLCDAARQMTKRQSPVLVVLARSLNPTAGILDAIAEVTGLARTGSELVSALSELAQRKHSRALIVIDGINEGDQALWRTGVVELVRNLRGVDDVGLVLSCRQPFDRAIFTERTRRPYVVTYHPGFGEQEFEAQLEFFHHYDIPVPRIPRLTPEFSNPLFLKLLCEGIARLARRSRSRTLREVTSGQKGMTFVLENYVRTAGRAIESDFGFSTKTCWKVLKGEPKQGCVGIAGSMASLGREWLHVDEAKDVLSRSTGVRVEDAATLLRRFITDGLLGEDVRYHEGAYRGVVVFPYQRFGDHLIARHLLEKHLTSSSEEAVRRSFYANRPLGKPFIVDRWGNSFAQPGIASALMLELPERLKRTGFQRELLWYLPRRRRLLAPVRDAFLDGLYWRSPDSFTTETDQIVDRLLEIDDAETRSATFEVLVTLATREDDRYDASHLYQRLAEVPMEDRDLTWSEYLRLSDEHFVIDRLLTWLELRDSSRQPSQAVENEIVLLSLGLTTTNRILRDRLTRALVDLGEAHPAALFNHVVRSLGFNDPYVPERMLAAAYGVAMRLWSDPSGDALRRELPVLAKELVSQLLAPAAPYGTSHTLMRGYGEGIVQLASRCAPRAVGGSGLRLVKDGGTDPPSPFRPPASITEDEVEATKGAIHMDFGNYTIGRLIPSRGNYQMEHPEYREVRRQIEGRMYELGYSSERFSEVDRRIGEISWRVRGGNETDRYGKKYSWIAYFEMYGLRAAQGLLDDYRIHERTSDCDIDPSFPSEPPTWRPSLPNVFHRTPTSVEGWIRRGPIPNYEHLFRPADVDGVAGPWVLLDGFVRQAGSFDREVFSFLRSILVRPRHLDRIDRFVHSTEYLGNHKIPDGREDYYAFHGEVAWSARYCPDVRTPRGKSRRDFRAVCDDARGGRRRAGIPVEVPVSTWQWESYHSELNQTSGITFPSAAICQALDLALHRQGSDLFDASGREAFLYREWTEGGWGSSHVAYLRQDLLDAYLAATGQCLLWIPWGERTLDAQRFQDDRSEAWQAILGDHVNNYGDTVRYMPSSMATIGSSSRPGRSRAPV